MVNGGGSGLSRNAHSAARAQSLTWNPETALETAHHESVGLGTDPAGEDPRFGAKQEAMSTNDLNNSMLTTTSMAYCAKTRSASAKSFAKALWMRLRTSVAQVVLAVEKEPVCLYLLITTHCVPEVVQRFRVFTIQGRGPRR